ncbi:hypothetical protein M2161_006326 [Streptomyces sp. SAI-133]|uniref:hypothetical protein n=1 Tax=unclassified Streptomyces TaxID=2593676 RepID=UPI0024755718|nr:hypothetical protein [Streptomyces sp. SAI-133]MDH6587220.1 hypothetical protein [Streptomyces sp. SAI-133]
MITPIPPVVPAGRTAHNTGPPPALPDAQVTPSTAGTAVPADHGPDQPDDLDPHP